MKEFTSLSENLIGLLLLVELALLARHLAAPRAGGPRPIAPVLRWAPLVIVLLFVVPATMVARSGALVPGVSGAGMPWESVTDATDLATSSAAGERAYLNRCAPCHLPTGYGLPPAYPPLVASPFVLGSVDEHVRIALWGSRGVRAPRAGAVHMPAFHAALSDAELAAILTYERNAWGHAAGLVRPSDVARGRDAGVREGLDRP